MKPFTVIEPKSWRDAAKAASSSGAQCIAGGTNLVDLMKHEIAYPSTLVNLRSLPSQGVRAHGGGLRVCALTTNTDLAADLRVRRDYPLISRAILAGASGQIRNRATVGGNLLQRTRCPYFYDRAKACNKREPGSGCSAMLTPMRTAALFAQDQCIAVNPSDMAVGLTALGASVTTIDPRGMRADLLVEKLHDSPDPAHDTILRPGRLIWSVEMPEPTGGVQLYRKVRDRASFAFALVSIGAVLKLRRGRIQTVRLAFGGVANRPWRARDAEELLTGERLSPAVLAEAERRLVQGADGPQEARFKGVLMQRLLTWALTSLQTQSAEQ